MVDLSRYPRFNDHPHSRPSLSMTGKTPLGELVWVAIPILVVVLALLAR